MMWIRLLRCKPVMAFILIEKAPALQLAGAEISLLGQSQMLPAFVQGHLLLVGHTYLGGTYVRIRPLDAGAQML